MKYPEVARRITEALQDAGIRPVDLSHRTGISKASISQYMSGTHCPTNVRAGQIAEVLKVNPAWLMDLSDDKHLAMRDEFIMTFELLPEDDQKEILRMMQRMVVYNKATKAP